MLIGDDQSLEISRTRTALERCFAAAVAQLMGAVPLCYGEWATDRRRRFAKDRDVLAALIRHLLSMYPHLKTDSESIYIPGAGMAVDLMNVIRFDRDPVIESFVKSERRPISLPRVSAREEEKLIPRNQRKTLSRDQSCVRRAIDSHIPGNRCREEESQ
jgi:hypothetical protein